MKSIGIDSIEINRFTKWANYPQKKLCKTFSSKEIEYCLQNKNKSAERFAARFATKEAFFKALGSILPSHKIPFLTICQNVSINHEANGNPQLVINWQKILEKYCTKIETPSKSVVSVTHTKTIATAIVIIL